MAGTVNGKRIIDATGPMTIEVKKCDIKRARRADPMTCAIARGALNGDKIHSVRIGTRVALVEMKDVALRYSIKPEDTEKIHAFDYAGQFSPGKYTLMPPKIPIEKKRKQYKKKKSGPAGVHIERRPPMRHMNRAKV